MEVPVKYDLGDEVYIVHDINSMFYAEQNAYVVKGINIKITDYSYKVFYTLVSGDNVFETVEDSVYSSYIEAHEACTLLNNN